MPSLVFIRLRKILWNRLQNIALYLAVASGILFDETAVSLIIPHQQLHASHPSFKSKPGTQLHSLVWGVGMSSWVSALLPTAGCHGLGRVEDVLWTRYKYVGEYFAPIIKLSVMWLFLIYAWDEWFWADLTSHTFSTYNSPKLFI